MVLVHGDLTSVALIEAELDYAIGTAVLNLEGDAHWTIRIRIIDREHIRAGHVLEGANRGLVIDNGNPSFGIVIKGPRQEGHLEGVPGLHIIQVAVLGFRVSADPVEEARDGLSEERR